jgi:biotin operon repressor
MFLDSFKRNVINQIVATDDGRELHDPLEPYFRAFTGVFDPGMPFTFYFEARNRPVMFVYDPTPIPAHASHAAFVEHCERIKAGILPITNFAQELAEGKYLTATPLESSARPPLPQNYENCWQKYKHFYADVMEGLEFVCFSGWRLRRNCTTCGLSSMRVRWRGEKTYHELGDKVTDKVTDNQKMILDAMSRNQHITTRELSEEIRISARKIKENIAKLKDKGLLERIGSEKSGYWKVIQ